MNMYFTVLLAIGIISLAACDAGPDSPRGFSLPQGDLVKGQQVFIEKQCLACHVLEGVKDDSIETELENPIKLGGESIKVTTYAELVTSVINPSHKIARKYRLDTPNESNVSPMRNYNDVMTVTELVDLVSYLQPQYKIKPYEYTQYGRYY